jgi:hypothetical protein
MPKITTSVEFECPECYNDQGYIVFVYGTAEVKKDLNFYNGVSKPRPIALHVDTKKGAACSVCDFKGQPKDFIKKE